MISDHETGCSGFFVKFTYIKHVFLLLFLLCLLFFVPQSTCIFLKRKFVGTVSSAHASNYVLPPPLLLSSPVKDYVRSVLEISGGGGFIMLREGILKAE